MRIEHVALYVNDLEKDKKKNLYGISGSKIK